MLTFEVVRGDDRTLSIPALDAEGQPYDLSAATLRWQARARPGAAETVFSKAGGQGITLPEGEGTTALVTIAALDWDAWSGERDLVWDLEAIRFGLTTTVARGRIVVVEDVVR